MNEVLEFLKKYHVFYLATVEGDQPRVRPFGVAEEYNGKLYTQTGKKKNVAQQLKANPKAEICCFGDGKWLRIECELIWQDDYDVLHALLEKNPNYRNADAVKTQYIKFATVEDDNTRLMQLYLNKDGEIVYAYEVYTP